jgi:hypothetical protein
MREVDRGSAQRAATAAAVAQRSEPPPSRGGFIGTNTDAAQAYVPPTALPDTPHPPAPATKVALSPSVDPRKAPTLPNLKQAAKSIAAAPEPVVEAPPDSQPSGMRRGSGYAPNRSVPPPAPGSRAEDAQRNTPVRPYPKVTVRPPGEAGETPAQRRAALLLIFLFAALLAIAVYFFLRSTQPATNVAAPSGTLATPPTVSARAAVTLPAVMVSATASPSAEASSEPTQAAPVFVAPRPAATATATATARDDASAEAAPPPPSAAPSVSAAPTASDKLKSGRWF